jgi:hypothetical protein
LSSADTAFQDDHARLDRQGTRNVHALLLPAGKLVRITRTEQIGVESHLHQHVARAAAGVGLPAAMHERAKGHGILHRHPRIERRVAVLEHHLHVAPQCRDGDAMRGADRFAIEDQFACVAFDEMQQQACQGGLAAAGFSDDAQGLTLEERERNAVDGTYPRRPAAAANLKMLGQVACDQQRLRGAADIAGSLTAAHPLPNGCRRSPG